MKNFVKIAQGINVAPLAAELHQNAWLWNQDKERLFPQGPHRDSDDIWVRYNDKTAYTASGDWTHFNDEHDPVWYDAFYALPSLKKIVFDLARHAEAERIGGVFIWRVKSGQKIHPHQDWGWHVDYYEKFNVCLQSAPGAAFVYKDEKITDVPGDVHRFTNTVDHEVVNSSDTDYIVMCVCLRTHDFRRRYKR